MKIVTIIGARPQFIKAAAVSGVLRKHFTEVLVHTGQHYDNNMSGIFFEELGIPQPDHRLYTGPGSHGAQTAVMLTGIEKILQAEKPGMVLVYGDTNTTLAGALAASKLCIPVVHVEAGLRSYNRFMPEEQNRVIADHLSEILFVSTKTAVDNLQRENITRGVYLVGDVMYDAIVHFSGIAETRSRILDVLGLVRGHYMLATVHRAENTNDTHKLAGIMEGLGRSGEKIVLPLHPRTRKCITEAGIDVPEGIQLTEPMGYLDMLMLEKHAAAVITDSGGMQKEAYFFGKPCITLRNETEWVETVENGYNVLTGADAGKICRAISNFRPVFVPSDLFGDGKAAHHICAAMQKHFS